MLPALIVSGLMLGSLWLFLSVYIRQLENFAGAMNFVMFPMFFFSSALYPLWKLREGGSELLYYVSLANPFTHAVELIRFALYGMFEPVAARSWRDRRWCSFCWLSTATIRSAACRRAVQPQTGLIGGGYWIAARDAGSLTIWIAASSSAARARTRDRHLGEDARGAGESSNSRSASADGLVDVVRHQQAS